MRRRLRVKEAVQASGLSMSQVARSANLSNKTVSDLCRDPFLDVKLKTLDSIAKVLGCNTEDLIETVD